MSFLYQNDVFAKILIDSGLVNKLTKQAQQAANEAKLLATKMLNNLMQQSIQSGVGENADTELYVKDLVDLDAFLNFLVKNSQRFNDKIIAYHDATDSSPPPSPELYQKYKTFYVLKDGLLDKLHELDMVSNQVGNEVMKPFIKGLINQINQTFKTDYQKEIPLPGERGSLGQKDKSQYQVGFGADQDTLENAANPNQTVSDKKTKTNKITQEDINALRDAMPFQSNNVLSPYNMYMFIHSIYQILQKDPSLVSGPMLGQYQQFFTNIYDNYNKWQNFVSQTSVATTSDGTKIAPNAASLRDEVPFDRSRRPITMLEELFGNKFKAQEAAQRLLQMVNLTQQALLSLNRSPKFMSLLGENVVTNQTNQAKYYSESLSPFAHSS